MAVAALGFSPHSEAAALLAWLVLAPSIGASP
jgi:hypothetical protein